MVLQPKRQTAIDIATETGELLPHLLTLTPIPIDIGTGRLFSSLLLYPHEYLSFREFGTLCCPDFPSRPDIYRDRDDETAYCIAKLIILSLP